MFSAVYFNPKAGRKILMNRLKKKLFFDLIRHQGLGKESKDTDVLTVLA